MRNLLGDFIDNRLLYGYAADMKPDTILYAGDTSLTTAACYLAGILTHYGEKFDYIPSDKPIASALDNADKYDLFIISDYPAENFTQQDFQRICDAVRAGAGLLMIGGWESFHGLLGEYNDTPLAEILPVMIQSSDDRVQSHKPWAMIPVKNHPIFDELDFANPPIVGGFNRISPKPDATELMQLQQLNVEVTPAGATAAPGETASLLTVGEFGSGKVAALATDVAPHWVGTFVDWGTPRVSAHAPGAEAVEIGSLYAKFFHNLISWARSK